MDVQTRNRIGCDDNGQHCNDTSFILAQTAGLQAGNIPIAISSGLRGPNCTARPDLFGTNCTAWLMKTQYLLFKTYAVIWRIFAGILGKTGFTIRIDWFMQMISDP